jgi:hypothetical protein
MNKNEFSNELRRRLSGLPQDELERTVSYFCEMIDDRVEDGMTESDAVASLQSFDEIARELAAERAPTSPNEYDGAGLRAVRVEDVNCPVILQPSGDGFVRLDYRENEKKHYEIELADGVLTVRGVPDAKWYNLIGLGAGWHAAFRPFVLSVPDRFAGDVTLRTKNAPVTASKTHITGALELCTTNTPVTARDISAGGAVTIHTTNARVSMSNLRAGGISAESSNGRLEAVHLTAQSDIALETSNGRIEVERLDAGDGITLRTSNGRVSGTVTGQLRDYSVRSRTSNGGSTLPVDMPGGSKRLEVYTSNGTIDLRFLG